MLLRTMLLRVFYKLFPFSLTGDAKIDDIDSSCDISCVINFYARIDLLEGILYSLAQQDFPSERFEVVLVEDRGGTELGKSVARRFESVLNIRYHPLPDNFGFMGYSRNYGISKSKGKYLLFLDDDTVILQKNFLSTLVNEFATTSAEGIVPHAMASYCLLERKYAHLDPYFPANRCTAYRRETIKELGGFVSKIIGQEDVEFVIRFLSSGRTAVDSPQLSYLHPPLLMPNLRKPKAVGASFYRLKSRYPVMMWLLLILNSARHAPLYLLPSKRFREMGRFGFGFLVGVIVSSFKKEGFTYS